MTHQELEEFIFGLPNAIRDYPFGEQVAVYRLREDGEPGKMFALIQEGSVPLRVSLKCDPQLAVTLRERYETVLPGYHLNKKHWNTIICSGQLSDDEIRDLARHSYQLVSEESTKRLR